MLPVLVGGPPAGALLTLRDSHIFERVRRENWLRKSAFGGCVGSSGEDPGNRRCGQDWRVASSSGAHEIYQAGRCLIIQ